MISVIMPSFLGMYPSCAKDRPRKLRRAIDSFLKQNIGELIIVADGCQDTISIVQNEYQYNNVKVLWVPKQSLFAGYTRQFGIQHANYDWVCYLDSDDEFLDNHLKTITDNIKNNQTIDWLYYNDIILNKYRDCRPILGSIGTSCIAHKRDLDITWPDGYNHDWYFIQQLLPYECIKIHNTGYVVHHIPGRIDD